MLNLCLFRLSVSNGRSIGARSVFRGVEMAEEGWAGADCNWSLLTEEVNILNHMVGIQENCMDLSLRDRISISTKSGVYLSFYG